MNDYQKGILVMDYLQSLNVSMTTVGEATQDKNLEKSFQLIKNNPKISKEEFLEKMNIEEEE